jgi:hypothetical protein
MGYDYSANLVGKLEAPSTNKRDEQVRVSNCRLAGCRISQPSNLESNSGRERQQEKKRLCGSFASGLSCLVDVSITGTKSIRNGGWRKD